MARKGRQARACPRDWTPLGREQRRTFLWKVDVDVCPKCGGLFLDKTEIRALTGSSNLHKLLTKHLGLDAESHLVCPHCGGLMDFEDADDVLVEVCLTCNGVWLDAGELERLAAKDDAEFRDLTPEKIDELLHAKWVKAQERRKAIGGLFRGFRRR